MKGWQGDNFPFTFNIAAGVYVMDFLPKPAEGVPGTERTPWYHRNVDYDGIALPPGLISHAPQCVHHRAPERARERARLVPSPEVLANDLGQHR